MGEGGTGGGQNPHPPSSLSRWRKVYLGRTAAAAARGGQRKSSSEWLQVYPRPARGAAEETPAEKEERLKRPGGSVAAVAAGGSWPPGDRTGGGAPRGPEEVSLGGGRGEAVGDGTRGERSLWAWAERGGVPIGRLLSLLSLRIANCGEPADRPTDRPCGLGW